MKIYKKPNGKALRFVGDTSYFEMNCYGVVWQEITKPHWGPDFIDMQLLMEYEQENFRQLGERAGAKRKLNPKTKELRFNFSNVPSESDVTL